VVYSVLKAAVNSNWSVVSIGASYKILDWQEFQGSHSVFDFNDTNILGTPNLQRKSSSSIATESSFHNSMDIDDNDNESYDLSNPSEFIKDGERNSEREVSDPEQDETADEM
jgi:hypothetical protein